MLAPFFSKNSCCERLKFHRVILELVSVKVLGCRGIQS